MFELLIFPRALGLMNASPFCMKAEVFLKLAGLPYQVNDRTPPMRVPKGKLPALRDAATLVCDSQAIVEHVQSQHADRLPAALLQPAQGADHALRRMFEEHLYFALLWHRWIEDTGWAATHAAFFSTMPAPLRMTVPGLLRRKIRRDLMGQGMGRHSPAEIASRACADLDAAQAVLGDRTFFGGADPSALDASIYAFLANVLFVELDNPMRRHVQAMPALVAYGARMEARVGR